MTTSTTAPPPGGTGPGADSSLTDTDREALAFLSEVNTCLRECLCTLARHGVALRLREPARAGALLTALAPWPVFKGGQFLFDLMEWEDFMIDGAPPPLVSPARIRSTAAPFITALAVAATRPLTPPGPLPGQRAATALDLPLRLLTATATTALRGTAADLADLFGGPPTANGRQEEKGETDTPHPGTETTGEPETPPPGTPGTASPEEDPDTLPPLEAGFHLYEDVALGTLVVLGPTLAAHAPAEEP